MIGAFLEHLEQERGNTVRPRNIRLAEAPSEPLAMAEVMWFARILENPFSLHSIGDRKGAGATLVARP